MSTITIHFEGELPELEQLANALAPLATPRPAPEGPPAPVAEDGPAPAGPEDAPPAAPTPVADPPVEPLPPQTEGVPPGA